MAPPRVIHGVDFSGAVDAGRKIWIASGVIEGSALRIEACRSAETLPGSGRNRGRCLKALRDFIGEQQGCSFGFDFPFGLPRALVKEKSWKDFVLAFARRYATPEKFRAACYGAAGGFELRRVTDLESRTPFSPYNLRLYRQTYFGIRDLLGPLVRDRLTCVLPMQKRLPGRPWLLEICPASVLKRKRLYQPYKGNGQARRAARARILRGIEEGGLSIPAPALRSLIVKDRDGDALDSVIAAFATFRTVSDPASLAARGNDAYALEGYVYV